MDYSSAPINRFHEVSGAIQSVAEDNFKINHTLVVHHQTPNGVIWKTQGEFRPKAIFASVGMKYNHPSGIALKNLEFRTDGQIVISNEVPLSRNLQLTVDIEDGRYEPGNRPDVSHGKLGCIGSFPNWLTFSSNIDALNGPTINSNFTLKPFPKFFPQLLIGGDFVYNTGLDDDKTKSSLTTYDFVGAYLGYDWFGVLRSVNRLSGLNFSLFHKLTPNTVMTTILEGDVRHNTQKLTIAGSHQFDEQTKLSAKINSQAVLALSLHQKLSSWLSLGITGIVNVRDLAADNHKISLHLTFGSSTLNK